MAIWRERVRRLVLLARVLFRDTLERVALLLLAEAVVFFPSVTGHAMMINSTKSARIISAASNLSTYSCTSAPLLPQY
ncbi:MAG: hypothetical protein P8Y36_02830 [Alphaproteobacteria bacterium]